MRTACLSGLILFSVLSAAGCSSDSSPGATGGTGGGGPTDGGKGAGGKAANLIDGGCADPTLVFNGVDQCLPKADAVTQCKTGSVKAQPGTSTTDPTCGAGCTCENCTAEMLACSNDPDGYCPTILKCATDKNCTGAACYAPATCQAVIDQAPPCAPDGGKCASYTSASVALATTVSDCATKAGVYPNRAGGVCAAACK